MSEHDEYDQACGLLGVPIAESCMRPEVEPVRYLRFLALIKALGPWLMVIAMAALEIASLASCTKLEPDVNDPTHAATWTSPIDCGTTTAHPCPYMTFATLATFYKTSTGKLSITWWAIADVPDVGADPELAELSDVGDIVLPIRGDSSGERMPSTLKLTPDGYEGDVAWLLYTVAGMTEFHLVIDRVLAP